MKKIPIDIWEDKFIEICEKYLEEEPLYPYEHLWKEGLSPKAAFEKYLEENPDYAEKLEEITETQTSQQEQAEFLAMAKKLEAAKKQKAVKEKLSKYCPECARVLPKSGVCKCGYNIGNNNNKEKDKEELDMADAWLASQGLDLDDDDI